MLIGLCVYDTFESHFQKVILGFLGVNVIFALKHNKLNIVGIRLNRLNEACSRNREKHLPAVQVQEYLINVVPLIEHVPLLAQGTSLHTVSGNMSTGSVIDVKWKH